MKHSMPPVYDWDLWLQPLAVERWSCTGRHYKVINIFGLRVFMWRCD